LPPWADIVKTGVLKELAPINLDWYYIRASVGAFHRIYCGSKREVNRPPHFGKSNGFVSRHILQQLAKVKIIEIDPG
ncbi:40S ribosomal protein S19-1, partial [Bienertia sinuspersici]